MGIKSLNGAMSVLGCTSQPAEGCSRQTTPLIFHKLPTSRGGENRERMSPEKAIGNLCCNICQNVLGHVSAGEPLAIKSYFCLSDW